MTFALGYDWLNGYLSDSVKTKMRQKMLYEGNIVYTKTTLNRQSYWNREWLQNHMWIAVTGMGAAGMAIYDEEPEALKFIEAANKHMSTTASVLPKDGGNHEGVDYWFYGMECVFMYAVMSREILGTDMLATEFFDKTTDYIVYNFLPRSFLGRHERLLFCLWRQYRKRNLTGAYAPIAGKRKKKWPCTVDGRRACKSKWKYSAYVSDPFMV